MPANLPSNRRRLSGFTLVELLVVIVIVAALAAIVFAVSRNVKEKAGVANCTSNLRQIGLALAHFNADNRRLPGRNDNMAWDRALMPYLGYNGPIEDLEGQSIMRKDEWANIEKAAEIFACPSDRAQRDSNVFKRSYAIVPWTTNWSNGNAFRGWKNRRFNAGVPLSLVNHPARAAVVVEWHAGTEGVPNCVGSGGHAYHDRGGPDGNGATVHGSASVVLFADGHTEKIPFMANADFVQKYWPGQIGNVD